MAITKTTINGDYSALQSFLQSSGLFGSVELGTDAVTMKDSDGNTIATIETGLTFRAYINASTSASVSYFNNGYVLYGYKCTSGVLLFVTGTSGYQAHILISKTNNNKVAFVFSSQHSSSESSYTKYYCAAWGDDDTSTFTFTGKASEQSLMCPFCTNAIMGETSYTPNAFWMPFGQYYNMGYGELTMNGVTYLTNGYWCIKDV